MKRHHALTAALLALLLTMAACTAAKPGAQPSQNPPGQTQPDGTQPDGTQPGHPGKAPPPLPTAPEPDGTILTSAPGGITYKTYPTGTDKIPTRDGFFTLDPATGEVESWSLSTPFNPDAWYNSAFAATDDGRYIIGRTQVYGYLIDRLTKAVYRFQRNQYELIAASEKAIIFEKMTPAAHESKGYFPGWGPDSTGDYTGEFIALGADLKVTTTFTLPVPAANNMPRPALLSPDATKLALMAGELFLVDLATGTHTAHAADSGLGSIVADRSGISFRLIPSYATDAQPVRYTWKGQPLPATVGTIDPTGNLTLIKQQIRNFTPSLIVADAALGVNKFRVLGADNCYGHGSPGNLWLADGSAALIHGRDGFYLASADGTLQKLSIFDSSDKTGWHEPFPSPTDANLFVDRIYGFDTWRIAVVDRTGKTHHSVTLEGNLATIGSLWHPTGAFVQLSFYLKGGSGAPCGDFVTPITPAIQQAPFPEDLTLEVKGTGDCLNLRAEPSTTATIVTCLKDGTKVKVATTPPGNPHQATQTWGDNHQWAWVQAPDGKAGWASLTNGYLTWSK